MKLVDFLTPERVIIPLNARTLDEAADALTEALLKTGLGADADELRKQLDSLPRDAVALGGQAFLIHVRTDAARQLAVVLGIAPEIITRDPESTKGARIVLLIVAPHRDAATYLQVVSTFARAMGRPEVISALLAARTPDDVLTAGALAEILLPGQLMVRDFMTLAVLSIQPDATLEAAARTMVEHGVPSLPVVSDSKEVLGIVSHREVLRHLLPKYVKRVTGDVAVPPKRGGSAAVDPRRLPVRDAMDRSVLCISEDQTLADVASLMVTKDLDRFPVVREGVLVGFITRGDIVRRLFGP